MIYVVTGFGGSGTSMMMEALIAGGLPGAYTKGNENFELEGLRSLEAKDFKAMDGKVVKVLQNAIKHIAMKGPAKAVFMRRDGVGRGESFMRKMPEHLHKRVADIIDDDIESAIEDVKSVVKNVDVLLYDDVVKDPKAAFEKLKASGWPIDVEKAAKIPKAQR